MNRISVLLFLVAAAMLQAAPFTTPDDWAIGTQFPAEPKISPKHQAGEVLQTIVTCAVPPSSLVAIRAEYAAVIPKENIAAVYDTGRDAMLKSMAADLVSEEKIKVGDHEGRRYVFKAKDGAKRGESWVFIVGNEIYQFIAGTKGASGAPATITFFNRIALRTKS